MLRPVVWSEAEQRLLVYQRTCTRRTCALQPAAPVLCCRTVNNQQPLFTPCSVWRPDFSFYLQLLLYVHGMCLCYILHALASTCIVGNGSTLHTVNANTCLCQACSKGMVTMHANQALRCCCAPAHGSDSLRWTAVPDIWPRLVKWLPHAH